MREGKINFFDYRQNTLRRNIDKPTRIDVISSLLITDTKSTICTKNKCFTGFIDHIEGLTHEEDDIRIGIKTDDGDHVRIYADDITSIDSICNCINELISE